MGHINNFCVKEIGNAHYAATLYHEIMQATPNVATSSATETKEEDATPATDGEKKEEEAE
jgi:hypothetical protein